MRVELGSERLLGPPELGVARTVRLDARPTVDRLFGVVGHR